MRHHNRDAGKACHDECEHEYPEDQDGGGVHHRGTILRIMVYQFKGET
jgi:hypothetical protein